MKIEKQIIKERQVTDLLVQAHNLYGTLPEQHPEDYNEWVFYLHGLQKLLAIRYTRRDHPDIYPIKGDMNSMCR